MLSIKRKCRPSAKGWPRIYRSSICLILSDYWDGWGSGHQWVFGGQGSMKVALALPYVGTSDHGGAFIYAQSIGAYTHGTDRIRS